MTPILAHTSMSLGPLVVIVVLSIVALRNMTRGRRAAPAGPVHVGPSAVNLPIIVAIIGLTTYIAAVEAGGGKIQFLANIVGSPALHGSGVKKSETRALGGFTALDVQSAMVKVDFTSGNGPATAVVEGDDNLISLIKTKVEKQTLVVTLESDTTVSTSMPLVVHVTGPAVEKATAETASSLSLPNFSGQSLTLEASSAATINASVTVKNLTISADSSAQVELSGSADVIKVAADSAARVRGKGSADSIEIKGDSAAVIDLRALAAQTAHVGLSSAASAWVSAARVVSGEVGSGAQLVQCNKSGKLQVTAEVGSVARYAR